MLFLGLRRGVNPKDSPPVCRGVHSTEACPRRSLRPRKKQGTKSMHIFIKVGGRLRGERLSYLSMYLFYSLPVIFSQIFSLATLARLPHLEMQASNVLYQPHLYFFIFWCHYLWLPTSKIYWKDAKNLLKLHKLRTKYQQQKIVYGVVGGEKNRGKSWELGEERHGCWGG